MSKEQLELREQKYFTVRNYNFYLYLFKNKFSINNKLLFLGVFKKY